MKNIIISVAGTEGKQEYKDVQILPGTKPRHVLAKLGLNGFQLSRPEGACVASRTRPGFRQRSCLHNHSASERQE